MVADGAVEGQHPLLNLAGGVHDQRDGISLWIAGHRLLRDQDGLFGNPFLHHGPDKHARKEEYISDWERPSAG